MRVEVSKATAAKVSATIVLAFIGAIAKRVVDDTADAANVDLDAGALVAAALSAWPIWLPWGLLGGLLWAIGATYMQDRKTRPARLLERYAMELRWGRMVALSDEVDDAGLDNVFIQVHDQRGELMNLTRTAFNPAALDAFKSPGMLNLGPAQRECEGRTLYDKRVSAVASVDHLLNAVEAKWRAYRGWEHPK